MSLLSQWREYAYGFDDRTPEGKQFWFDYFQAEKESMKQFLQHQRQIL